MKSEDTRKNALKKMERFGVKVRISIYTNLTKRGSILWSHRFYPCLLQIGYPDKWINYETLVITEDDSFLAMVFKAREFDNEREIKEMNAPTDRAKWHMTPQTVNAYYHPSLNEIVFPAAILQHPFFDRDADDAVNFGSMGAGTCMFRL